MFEFFIALFGGAYYLGKYASEKHNRKAFNNKQEEYRRLREELRALYCLSYQQEREIQNYILKGEHYEDICNKFADDFKFVFGLDWKTKLRIPPKFYEVDASLFCLSANHTTWVYYLILASKGRISNDFLFRGYRWGGLQDREMCIRFAQCIEKHLVNTGANIKLVLEKNELGDRFIEESLVLSSAQRLW